ncbi:homoserine kinase [uncultured Faecalibaculum sp.]|uniref:homoserine kinase n=1 Tax=uncultured Faecalibaculum sp. TaxID=1729681 RepID=UPI0025E053D5|nr:homoserine kinase [uncultured Faecalibaculum sp.]
MIRISVPATSANCGAGFDTMGLALDWRGEFSFEKADRLVITGCPEAYAGEDNLVWRAYQKGCRAAGFEPDPLHIHIETDIPFARGLGSSATCIVAGLAAAWEIHGQPASRQEVMALAAEMEGHPDNVAPAVFGDLCTTVMTEDQAVMCASDMSLWHCLALVPDLEVSTAEARKVLPGDIPLKTAARQAGMAALFVQGLERGDQQLVCAACQDRLHEPYRQQLIPAYSRLKEVCMANAVPLWISGSGSTMLAISRDREQLESMRDWVSRHFGLEGRLVDPDGKGLVICHE